MHKCLNIAFLWSNWNPTLYSAQCWHVFVYSAMTVGHIDLLHGQHDLVLKYVLKCNAAQFVLGSATYLWVLATVSIVLPYGRSQACASVSCMTISENCNSLNCEQQYTQVFTTSPNAQDKFSQYQASSAMLGRMGVLVSAC